jgi:hypothetical protein
VAGQQPGVDLSTAGVLEQPPRGGLRDPTATEDEEFASDVTFELDQDAFLIAKKLSGAVEINRARCGTHGVLLAVIRSWKAAPPRERRQ